LDYKPELFKPFTIRQIKKIMNDSQETIKEDRSLSPVKSENNSPTLVETTTNIVDRIIQEQLLPRKEQVELERQRRRDEAVKQD
jgi:hypothetical protein